MRVNRQPAFVLHTRPYLETSLIADFLTLDFGKVSCVVKGARRANSKYHALLQPFNAIELSWHGKHDLKTASTLEGMPQTTWLAGKALFCGLYVNELLERLLTPYAPLPQLFVYYQAVITDLASGSGLEEALRSFELQLLDVLGYGFDFSMIEPGGYYGFIPEQGFLPAEANADQPTFYGSDLLALAQHQLTNPQVKQVAKQLMRMQVNYLLDYKPLKSRQLFAVKRQVD